MGDENFSELRGKSVLLILFVMMFLVGFFGFVNSADPVGPDSLTSAANETKTAPGAIQFNISGGYVSTFNLSATVQNPRWKAFVGQVIGSFTLDDSTGATIYDWTLSTVTGRIYATRNGTTIAWSVINCSNRTYLTAEDTAMSHSGVNDNITKTFNTTSGATHNAFYVGSVLINANSCPTLNTYINNASQDTDFEEVALYTSPSIVYATILEENTVGFDGGSYDFQMIVPENGAPGFAGSTAYYLYVELGS